MKNMYINEMILKSTDEAPTVEGLVAKAITGSGIELMEDHLLELLVGMISGDKRLIVTIGPDGMPSIDSDQVVRLARTSGLSFLAPTPAILARLAWQVVGPRAGWMMRRLRKRLAWRAWRGRMAWRSLFGLPALPPP